MPYCPKCDMEFIDGITVCSDCKGPLVASRDAYLAMQAEEAEQKAREEAAEPKTDLAEFICPQDEEEDAESGSEPVHVYVDSEKKYEDLASSASAFLLVGAAALIVLALQLAGTIKLPLSGFSFYMEYGFLLFITVFSFGIFIYSRISAKAMLSQIKDEKAEREEIISWFLETYSAQDVDERVPSSGLGSEETALKRYDVITDLLVTGRDIPDKSFADALAEDIYERIYPES